MDYETRHLAGLDWEVVPTPAQTQGAVSYIVTLNGRRLAFVGETVCGHGRTGRLAPLQYNYNDLTGAVNLWKSAGRLLNARPDRILPSLGEPADDPTDAVNALRANLRKLDNIQPGLAEQFKDPDPPQIPGPAAGIASVRGKELRSIRHGNIQRGQFLMCLVGANAFAPAMGAETAHQALRQNAVQGR